MVQDDGQRRWSKPPNLPIPNVLKKPFPLSHSPLHTKSGRLFVAPNPNPLKWSCCDRWLECFGPFASLIVVVCPYYGAAVAFYCAVEDKACESDLLLNEPNYDAATCREGWTIIDALYFTTVSVSTVGYGDLTCSNGASRAFTALWIVVGLVVVISQISNSFHGAIANLTSLTIRGIDLVLAPTGNSVRNELEAQTSQSPFVYYLKGLAIGLAYFFFFQGFVAATIAYVDPHLDSHDVIWYCFITATTVGYGDINVVSQMGRLLATVHVLLSVVWLTALLGHVRELSARRQRQLKHATLLKRSLDHSILEQMDRHGRGVDQTEFVIESLMHLGAELGGEPLKWHHVTPIRTQFRAFDVNGDGRLTHKDLERLAELRGAMVAGATATQPAGSSKRLLKKAASVNLARRLSRQNEGAGGGGGAADGTVRKKQWADGTRYEGAWADGAPCGRGVTTWADGSSYTGIHRGGAPHGVGTMAYASGERYEGGFEGGQRHGQGTLSYTDGARWEGMWEKGMRHGRGVKVAASGAREHGEWRLGERVAWMAQQPAEASGEAKGQLHDAARTQDSARGGGLARSGSCTSLKAKAVAALGRKKSVRIVPEQRP